MCTDRRNTSQDGCVHNSPREFFSTPKPMFQTNDAVPETPAPPHRRGGRSVDLDDYPELIRFTSSLPLLARYSQPQTEERHSNNIQQESNLHNPNNFRSINQGDSLLGKRTPEALSTHRRPNDRPVVTPLTARRRSEPSSVRPRLKMKRTSAPNITELFVDTSSSHDDPFFSARPLPKLVPFGPGEFSTPEEKKGFQNGDGSPQVHPSKILFPNLD
eukprot:CAMPEP_0198286368 /NCGR_PEP_ID=MMETSP1449-20131203/5470_1 /TAXON_ID=420275 /ORGANISM="Attheya septentrionalis, Strain CCMP2084" /LENGTH=215 /DNA_ID=CAMNT_0043984085 /DNA_START=284 /DNA_END=931 /DNA_ORIENTATION=+